MKKSKKLFLFGKLRDLSTLKYEVEVGKELREYMGVKDVEIAFYELPDPDGHGTEFVLGLASTASPNKDSIPLEIAMLILGESKTFKPEYPAYIGPKWPGFDRCNVFIDKEEFEETYKANNRFYGGSKIKSIEVREDDELGTIIKVKW